jgi:predicted Fe-Mo cluster-binding NifX family protein
MKIAFPGQDGKTISAHFGSAPIYTVIEIENQKIISREDRHNPATAHSSHHEQIHNHDKFELLKDCKVVIAGGMGENAFDRLTKMGISVFLVDNKNIEEALEVFMTGNLVHNPKRVHHHHSH